MSICKSYLLQLSNFCKQDERWDGGRYKEVLLDNDSGSQVLSSRHDEAASFDNWRAGKCQPPYFET